MKIEVDGPEHEFEAAPGLPEKLPAGERLLWQGAPDWQLLAVECFHVRKLCWYFGAILGLRALFVVQQGGNANEATRAVLMLLPLALLALGMALGTAWLSARTALYTITDKRVVMRVGIVLSLTFNLPLRVIGNAGLRVTRDGAGDIPLALAGDDRIAYVHLWPHARPWRVARPEPMLRCVPDAARVAKLLAAAWSHAHGLPAAPAAAPRRHAGSGVGSKGALAHVTRQAGSAGGLSLTAGR